MWKLWAYTTNVRDFDGTSKHPTSIHYQLGFTGGDRILTLTESMLLGNVAFRLGKPIAHDPSKGEVTNIADAAKLIARQPRVGWKL